MPKSGKLKVYCGHTFFNAKTDSFSFEGKLTLCLPHTNPLCAMLFGGALALGHYFRSNIFSSLYLFICKSYWKTKKPINNACPQCEPETMESLHWAIQMNNSLGVCITVQIGERGIFTDVQIGERGKQRVNM